MSPSKSSLWQEEPADPARPRSDDERLRGLLNRVDGEESWPLTDLGGTMSLNLMLSRSGTVLRVHQPFESRRRILALRQLRCRLDADGLVVGVPLPIQEQDLVRWHGRWAELERHVVHTKPAATWESYCWMYGAMGRLHRSLGRINDVELPRPTVATYGPPTTLRRWMALTTRAVAHDAGAANWRLGRRI